MSLVVYAPASIGNVSVGFDLLGAAISPIDGSLLGDRVLIQASSSGFELNLVGAFVDELPQDPKQNIVYQCWLSFNEKLKQKGLEIKPVLMTLEKNMPVGSGLGSSASSIVAALVALNKYHQSPLSDMALLALMGEMEGLISGSVHFDNVAPCYLGGLQLMIEELGIISQEIPCFDHWVWLISYPGIRISTAQARDILPCQYNRKETIDYGRNLAGFIHACHSNQPKLAAKMIKDVIAEPYRSQLLPNFEKAKKFAQDAGALAFGISGSGPTLFTLCPDKQTAEKIQLWQKSNYIQNQTGFSHICQLNRQGAHVTGSQL